MSAVLCAFVVSSVPAAYGIINSDVTNGNNTVIFTFEATIVIPPEDDPIVDCSPAVVTDSMGNPLPNPAYEFEYTGTMTGTDDFSAGIEGVFCFTFSVDEIIHITVNGTKYNFQTEIGKYYSMVDGVLYSANTLDDVVWMVAHYNEPIIFKIHREAIASGSFMTLIYWT